MLKSKTLRNFKTARDKQNWPVTCLFEDMLLLKPSTEDVISMPAPIEFGLLRVFSQLGFPYEEAKRLADGD